MGAGLDTLLTFCGERVRGFGDDDPGDDVGEKSSTCEEDTENPENADQGDVPTIVEGEAGADATDDAGMPWPIQA
jgi:hypothetical protein